MNTERSAWLAELYESNFSRVFRICSGILRNPDDAADASQEVFLTAAGSLRPGTSKAAVRAWLQTVARNHCLDVLRRRKRLGRALVTLGPDGDGRTDVAATVADRDFVDGILKKLSPRERQALWQSAVEHRAVDDIAGRLQLSYMAAAQVIHRARRHAMELATRVAIVFGMLRLGRRASQLKLTAASAAVVPMIALSAISLQSSGTPPTAAVAVYPAHAPSPTLAPGKGSSLLPQVGTGNLPLNVPPVVPGGIPSSADSTVTSLLNAAKDVTGVVPALPVTSPSPALPLISPSPKLP